MKASRKKTKETRRKKPRIKKENHKKRKRKNKNSPYLISLKVIQQLKFKHMKINEKERKSCHISEDWLKSLKPPQEN